MDSFLFSTRKKSSTNFQEKEEGETVWFSFNWVFLSFGWQDMLSFEIEICSERGQFSYLLLCVSGSEVRSFQTFLCLQSLLEPMFLILSDV